MLQTQWTHFNKTLIKMYYIFMTYCNRKQDQKLDYATWRSIC